MADQSIPDLIRSIATQMGEGAGMSGSALQSFVYAAMATAYQESGFNPQAVGDNGTSFGLFQLHEGGELGSNTPQWAYDPANNIRRALQQFISVYQQNPDIATNPGEWAAEAQRPGDPSAYAESVNSHFQQFSNGSIPIGPSVTGVAPAGIGGGVPQAGFQPSPWGSFRDYAAGGFGAPSFAASESAAPAAAGAGLPGGQFNQSFAPQGSGAPSVPFPNIPANAPGSYIFPQQYLQDQSLAFGAPDIGNMTEPGIDFAMPVGQPLRTPVGGVVHIEDKGKSDWGKRVIVTLPNGYSFGIGHLSDFAPGLKDGQQIQAGALLGLSGGDPNDPSSGETTGPHIEVQWIDPQGNFQNPQQSGLLGTPIAGSVTAPPAKPPMPTQPPVNVDPSFHQAAQDWWNEQPHPQAPSVKVKDFSTAIQLSTVLKSGGHALAKEAEDFWHEYEPLLAKGLTPDKFMQAIEQAGPLSWAFHGRPPSLAELESFWDEKAQALKPISQITDFFKNLPDKHYPHVTAGDMVKSIAAATPFARQFLGRDPVKSEAAFFHHSGVSPYQHYQQMAQPHRSGTQTGDAMDSLIPPPKPPSSAATPAPNTVGGHGTLTG